MLEKEYQQPKRIPVCKNCGALGKKEEINCIYCGTALDPESYLLESPVRISKDIPIRNGHRPTRENMQVKPWDQQGDGAFREPRKRPQRASAADFSASTQWQDRILAILSLAFGIISVIMMALEWNLTAVPLAAVVLGIISLAKKMKGGIMAAFGIGLGVFSLIVLGFWAVLPIFYFF